MGKLARINAAARAAGTSSSTPLVRSKERKKALGEVFTPPALVDKMLNKIPSSHWVKGKAFLEPSCGNGNFVLEILHRKVLAGCTPLEALQDTYAIDISRLNIIELHRRAIDWALPQLSSHQWGDAQELIVKHFRVGDALQAPIGDGRWWETVPSEPYCITVREGGTVSGVYADDYDDPSEEENPEIDTIIAMYL